MEAGFRCFQQYRFPSAKLLSRRVQSSLPHTGSTVKPITKQSRKTLRESLNADGVHIMRLIQNEVRSWHTPQGCRRAGQEGSSLPGWRWARVEQLVLVGLSSSWHSRVCNALGDSSRIVHSKICICGSLRTRDCQHNGECESLPRATGNTAPIDK